MSRTVSEPAELTPSKPPNTTRVAVMATVGVLLFGALVGGGLYWTLHRFGSKSSCPAPSTGSTVAATTTSGAERDDYEATIMRVKGTDTQVNLANARAKLVAKACVDENGARLFSDDDVKALSKKSALALQRVFDAASRLSGLSKQDMEDLTKNSGNGQREDSPIA